MDKVEFIEYYIQRCNLPEENQGSLIREIVCTFKNDIPHIYKGLTEYGISTSNHNYSGDLSKLKSILINYKCDLQRDDKIRAEELEKLELQRQIISITTINQNDNNSHATATAIATVTINQTLNNINELPEGVLNREESLELKELIHAIDEMLAAKNNVEAKSKISKVLSTIGNKGFDIFVAIAPYLIQAAGIIQTTN